MAKRFIFIIAGMLICLSMFLVGCSTSDPSDAELYYQGLSDIKPIESELLDTLKRECLNLLDNPNLVDCYIRANHPELTFVTLEKDPVTGEGRMRKYQIDVSYDISVALSQYTMDGGISPSEEERLIEIIKNSSFTLENDNILIK